MAIAACATPLVGAIAEKFGFEGAATRSVPQHGYLHKGVASTACDVFADLLQCCATRRMVPSSLSSLCREQCLRAHVLHCPWIATAAT